MGDFAAVRDRVATFVSAFANVGVRLVVFIDGTVPADKMPTYLARRRSDAKDVVVLNQLMKRRSRRGPVGRVAHKELRRWVSPPFGQTHLGRAFRECGAFVWPEQPPLPF